MSDDDQDAMSPSERRIGVRHFACFPAHVERPDGEKRTAMIHDLSATGALLLVRTKLDVGDVVHLELFVTGEPDAPSPTAAARVVRVELLGPKALGLWSHRVAVHFEEPLKGYEAEIAALEEKQRKLGVLP